MWQLEKDVEDVNNAMHREEPRPVKIVEDNEFSYAKDVEFSAAKVVENKEFNSAKDAEFVATKVVEDKEFSAAMDSELVAAKDMEQRSVMDVEETKLKLTKEVDEIKSKLNVLDSKLLEVSLFPISFTSRWLVIFMCGFPSYCDL